jgi:hypothetical protein
MGKLFIVIVQRPIKLGGKSNQPLLHKRYP